MNSKVVLNWSSGKDSSFALYKLLQAGYNKKNILLLSVITFQQQRVTMHGIERKLLEKQAEAIGIKLISICLEESNNQNNYEKIMLNTWKKLKKEKFTKSAFGDIFLEDLKNYRINQLNKVNVEALFPIWGYNTRKLCFDIIQSGFKAIVVCVNLEVLDKSFCGRDYNEDFINDLPQNVDPCGENGEFHTFCYSGPVFNREVCFEKSDIVIKKYKTSEREYNYAFLELKPL